MTDSNPTEVEIISNDMCLYIDKTKIFVAIKGHIEMIVDKETLLSKEQWEAARERIVNLLAKEKT